MKTERVQYTNDREAWKRLASAIVVRAAEDYVLALRAVKRCREDKCSMQDALSLERFFHSQWYDMLTDMDGDYLIKRMRQAVARERVAG